MADPKILVVVEDGTLTVTDAGGALEKITLADLMTVINA